MENYKLRCERDLVLQLAFKQEHPQPLLLFALCCLCVHLTPYQHSKMLSLELSDIANKHPLKWKVTKKLFELLSCCLTIEVQSQQTLGFMRAQKLSSAHVPAVTTLSILSFRAHKREAENPNQSLPFHSLNPDMLHHLLKIVSCPSPKWRKETK